MFAAGFTNTNALFFNGGFATAAFVEAAFAGADFDFGFLGRGSGLVATSLGLVREERRAAPRGNDEDEFGAILANGRGLVRSTRVRYAFCVSDRWMATVAETFGRRSFGSETRRLFETESS